MPTIAVMNFSTLVSDDEVRLMTEAAHVQVVRDFGPIWGKGATVVFRKRNYKGDDWPIGVFDDSDQAGALGYHTVTAQGSPCGKVFAADCAKYGAALSVDLTHEVLETLADPSCVEVYQVGDSAFIAREVGDPVEADGMGYTIDGVLVTDFVHPGWFTGEANARTHQNTAYPLEPLTLAPGGYASIWEAGKGWQQVTAKTVDGSESRAVRTHRPQLRVHDHPEPTFELTDVDVRPLAADG